MNKDVQTVTGLDTATHTPPRCREPGYVVVSASFADDRETILALWDSGLARGSLQKARLEWYYECNPEGLPQTFLLRIHGSQGAVGVATVARRRMRLGAESLLAGFLVDFVVDPKHRSFFPALFLQRELLRQVKEARAVVFGTPNARSEAIVRRAGYRCVGKMVRLARVLRSRAYLSRYLPDWLSGLLGAGIDRTRHAISSLRGPANSDYLWEWRDRPGPDFDALWERVAPSGALIGVRDSAFLTWRFVESPYHAYRFFALVSKAERELVAYAVCYVQEETMHVADFLADPTAPDAGWQLWLDLSREAYRRGHRSLSVAFLGNDSVRRQLDAVGMVARGEQPLYAAFEDREQLTSPSNWYVTNADEDG